MSNVNWKLKLYSEMFSRFCFRLIAAYSMDCFAISLCTASHFPQRNFLMATFFCFCCRALSTRRWTISTNLNLSSRAATVDKNQAETGPYLTVQMLGCCYTNLLTSGTAQRTIMHIKNLRHSAAGGEAIFEVNLHSPALLLPMTLQTRVRSGPPENWIMQAFTHTRWSWHLVSRKKLQSLLLSILGARDSFVLVYENDDKSLFASKVTFTLVVLGSYTKFSVYEIYMW